MTLASNTSVLFSLKPTTILGHLKPNNHHHIAWLIISHNHLTSSPLSTVFDYIRKPTLVCLRIYVRSFTRKKISSLQNKSNQQCNQKISVRDSLVGFVVYFTSKICFSRRAWLKTKLAELIGIIEQCAQATNFERWLSRGGWKMRLCWAFKKLLSIIMILMIIFLLGCLATQSVAAAAAAVTLVNWLPAAAAVAAKLLLAISKSGTRVLNLSIVSDCLVAHD